MTTLRFLALIGSILGGALVARPVRAEPPAVPQLVVPSSLRAFSDPASFRSPSSFLPSVRTQPDDGSPPSAVLTYPDREEDELRRAHEGPADLRRALAPTVGLVLPGAAQLATGRTELGASLMVLGLYGLGTGAAAGVGLAEGPDRNRDLYAATLGIGAAVYVAAYAAGLVDAFSD